MDIKEGGVEGGLKSGKSNEFLQRKGGQYQQQQQDKERLQVEIHHGSKWGHGPRASELAHLLQMGRGQPTNSYVLHIMIENV